MKPLLSTDDSSLAEPQQSSSFSDVFDPSSPSFFLAYPVRASTPVSSDGDSSVTPSYMYDTSCSVAGPQNISLVSQDLTASFSSSKPSPTKDHNSDVTMQDYECVDHPSYPNNYGPYQLCDGYQHGFMCFGFKLVGDNLDKTIKPRDMSQSLHYFNIYAVLDRVDFRSLSCDTSIIDVAKVDTNNLLPSAADMEAMITNFSVLISRLLVNHIPALCEFSASVPAHIDHKYSREMSAKSHVVRTNNHLQCDNCVVYMWLIATVLYAPTTYCRYLLV